MFSFISIDSIWLLVLSKVFQGLAKSNDGAGSNVVFTDSFNVGLRPRQKRLDRLLSTTVRVFLGVFL